MILQVCDAQKNFVSYAHEYLAKKQSCSGKFNLPYQLPVMHKQAILDRCGFFEGDLDGRSPLICDGHVELMTTTFKSALGNKNCLDPRHGRGRTTVTTGQPFQHENSRVLFKYKKILIPHGSSVCFNHRNDLDVVIEPFLQKEAKLKCKKTGGATGDVLPQYVDMDLSPSFRRIVNIDAVQETGDPFGDSDDMDIGLSVSQQPPVHPRHRKSKLQALESLKQKAYGSQGSSAGSSVPSQPDDKAKDPDTGLSKEDFLQLKKAKFNEVLKLGGFDEKYNLTKILKHDFDEVSETRANQVLDPLGAFLAAGIHTVAEDPNQARKILNGLVNKLKKVEKHLAGNPIPDKFLSEIIQAYCARSGRKEYINILTTLVEHMTYPEIQQFNAPSKNDYPQAEYDEELLSTPSEITLTPSSASNKILPETDESDSEDTDEDNEDQDADLIAWNVPEGCPQFDPPVSRRWYNAALKHHRKFGHALKEIVTQNYRERIPDGLLRRIVDFFCDPSIINQVIIIIDNNIRI